MRFDVITLFPELFAPMLKVGVTRRAFEAATPDVRFVNPRDFAEGNYNRVDDRPFGGGPGMVMRADILAAAIDTVQRHERPLIVLSPRGLPLTQARARELSAGPGAVFVCGRFEGIDQRVIEARALEEISVGDYVLSGGELAAMIVIDAVVRLLPGVVGADASLDEESFEQGLLEYPHYTRPQVWEGREIPAVLTSGHHQRIRDWRREQSLALTKQRRPDLYDAHMRRAGGASSKH